MRQWITMSTKKISIKVNNSKETIEQYSVTGGENGAGKLKQPLHINAQKDVNYLLVDEETQFAPENIAVKRVDKNLVIAFEGGDVENPDLIIENYFADNGAIGYQDGSSNLIIGQYENGQYFPYVPESAVKADAISQLADGQAAGQAIGGDALPPIWAFNPWWLAALVPLIGIPAVAISGGGGGGGHSKVVDHAPIAGDDSAHAKHNTPVAIHVTANDSDVDGDLNPNSIRIVKEGSKGTVAIGKDGKIIYTPNKGEYGVDTVTYVVKDKAGHESNVATITINIDAAPEAKDDTAATKESKPVTIDMENNYSDKDGDVDHSSLEIRTNGGKGFARFVNGKLVYQPNKGEVGTDTITYTVTDKNGNVSEDATITINIDAPPVANDDSAKANKATPVELDVLVNDTDLDGDIDPTTLEVVGEPTKGTVKVVDGKLVYTANPEATGQDTITYLVKDKNGNVSNKATVTIDITEPPVANKDEAETRHSTPVEIDITANDTDRDGDLDKSSVVITHPGTKGTVTIGENGKLTYTPNPGEHGTDTITYQIKDKAGNISNEATITVKIDAAPVATNDKTDTRHNTPVEIDITANDTDTDGDLDKNSVLITQPGSKGTVTIGEDGKLTYTPNKGEHGTDTITYQIKDKNGNVSNTATVTVVIDAPPVANKDSAAIKEGETVTLDVLANDTDLDGKDDIDPSTLTIITNGGKGTAEFVNGKLVYTAKPGEVGTDTITYTVKDKNGNVSNETTVTIVIDAAPVANKDSAAIKEGETVTLDVLANDTDLDGKDDIDPSTLTIITNGGKGTAEFVNGKLVYTAKPGEVGTDTITYTVKDKNGNVSNETTVTIVIDAAPIANKDSAKANKAIPVEIDVLKNDTDLDGDIDPTTLEVVGEPTKGTVKVVDGQLVYTANPDATGQDIITYLVKDKNGNVSNKATVTIAINEPPVAGDDHGQTKQGVPTVIDVLNNDKDPDGELDKSTLHIEKNGSKGTATFDADGKLIYTPKPGAIGQDTITYTVKDNDGKVSNIATVTIDIAPTQTTPTEVFEKGLRTDGTAGSSAIVADGVVILANPDDKPVAEQDIQITKPTTELTSGGKPITWESTDNGFVGKDAGGKDVITLTTNSSTENGQTKVGYEVTLKGLVDHPVGKESLNIEFGVKNGNDEVKTEIVVHDDKPEAANVELSVEPPSENTFYANLIISLDLSSSMGKDDSGIQNSNSSGMKTRYDAALDSIDSLLNSYEERLNSADAGEVRVSINGFAKKASAIGAEVGYPMDQPYWCTIAEARKIVEGLRGYEALRPDWGVIGVDTNYDAALQQVISIFQKTSSSGMEPIDAKNIDGKLDNTLFVITDGIPNFGNQDYTQQKGAGAGIDPTSPEGYVPGSPTSDIGEDNWKSFLTEKGIRSVAIGIGQDMLKSSNGKTGEEFIKPIAFDGQKGENNDANDVIVLKDMSSLGNILSKYVPNENTIESNFAEGSDGKTTLSFGADGKSSISIDVDGVTYTYDANKGTITSNGTDKSKWADFGEGEVAIKTDAGGLLSISLGDKNFGHLTYRPGATRPTGMTEEKFTLTLTDKDGTSSKPTITVDISKLKESGNTGLNDTDLTALKLFSPESAMELHGVDTDVNATSSHSTGFMNSSLDALQETQHAMI
ncbi:von Willebrand factor type A domain protein [Providencia rustigianii DSM 4541]|uniref:von Willebrand factor type A domain protein n=3 Tax=Providencia rustigianii TaxID=158850 RepID=D1P663_9GAMM|nr:von Willebrand factor type A domain protein [Providencia rustigianii DSM 4541]